MDRGLTHNKEADGLLICGPVLANRKFERCVQWLQINARRDMVALGYLGGTLRRCADRLWR
jgi:hypothetical protein